jgi:endonuclease III
MVGSTIERLERFYGALPAPPRDPFAFFVWEVLSVHSTPRQRDAALAALKRIPALTPDAMHRAPAKKILDAVTLAGSYLEPRLRALRAGVDAFRRTPRLAAAIRGPLPAARRAVEALPQPAGGDPYRMLLFAGNHAVLPIDAAVTRVVTRLGGAPAEVKSGRARRLIRESIDVELADDADACRRVYLYLAHHGAATCTAVDPHCAVCPLQPGCAYANRSRAAESA